MYEIKLELVLERIPNLKVYLRQVYVNFVTSKQSTGDHSMWKKQCEKNVKFNIWSSNWPEYYYYNINKYHLSFTFI